MSEEERATSMDLSKYRLERAREDMSNAKILFENGKYKAANNRSYYAIFHALRSVLAMDNYDSKRHSGIISEFQKRYIKEGVFPKEISRIIDSAFIIRNASDYDDMFIADKSQTETQMKNAEYVIDLVQDYLDSREIGENNEQ